MQNVVLSIHLILALLLVGIVLLQRSEGGGLGIGGGGGAVSSRPATTGIAKLTWALAVGFLVTSLTLTVLASREAESGSVAGQITTEGGQTAPATNDLLTPAPTEDRAKAPAADAPATPQKAED